MGFTGGRLDGNFDRWRWVTDTASMSAVLPWLSLLCKVSPKATLAKDVSEQAGMDSGVLMHMTDGTQLGQHTEEATC